MDRLKEFHTKLQSSRSKLKVSSSSVAPHAISKTTKDNESLSTACQALGKRLQDIVLLIRNSSVSFVVPAASLGATSAFKLLSKGSLDGWTEDECNRFEADVKKGLSEVQGSVIALRASIEARISSADSARAVRQGLRERERRDKMGLVKGLRQGIQTAKFWLGGQISSEERHSKVMEDRDSDYDEAGSEDNDLFSHTAAKHFEVVLTSIENYVNQCHAQLIELRQERQENKKDYSTEQNKTDILGKNRRLPVKDGSKVSKSTIPFSDFLQSTDRPKEHDSPDSIGDSSNMLQMQQDWRVQEARQWKAVLETDLDAAQETEKKMESIAQLMQFFSIKVAEQAECIQSIHHNTVNVNVNIVSANDELRQAISNGGRSSMYLILFFIGAALSLMFLDWMS